ncbi:SDR family NAD(P)-dependent oxidoreductase, partial [Rhizobium ruizarguesonis]|uniref:SDR family NAD(P)-dependent oxidoreductase n=1 Tax=Rhizobium ruizarguesonis TaxID=2081791 RepID=UPI001031934F
MDLGIKGKRALVLASSRGLGLGIAVALAREGANVLLCGRSGEQLEANCKAINAEGKGRADWIWADLGDERFVAMTTTAVKEKFGGLDILVNNTGGPMPGTTALLSGLNLVDKVHGVDSTRIRAFGDDLGHERGTTPCGTRIAS